MNEAREAVDVTMPEVRELLDRGCLEIVHVRLDPYAEGDSHRWVAITELGRETVAVLSPPKET